MIPTRYEPERSNVAMVAHPEGRFILDEEIAALTAKNKRQAEEIRVLRNALCDYNPDHDALNAGVLIVSAGP